MRTPSNYTKNIRAGIVTKDMLAACLYSVNKRAKNARDKEREYNSSGICQYADKYHETKEEYYNLKEQLLEYATNYLSCIHRVRRNAKRKVYDYEKEYYNLNKDNVIRRGEFWDEGELCYTRFAVITYVKYEYFLFYDMGDCSFHRPLEEHEVVDVANRYSLPIKEIDDLQTLGKDFTTLVSMQFVKQVLTLLQG